MQQSKDLLALGHRLCRAKSGDRDRRGAGEAITDRCWFYVIRSNTEFVRLSIAYIKNDDELSVTLNVNDKSRSSCVFVTTDILTNSTIKRVINSSTIILGIGTKCVPAYASAINANGKWYLDYTAINALNGITASEWTYITQVTHPTLNVIWSFISITTNTQTSTWVGVRVNDAFSISTETDNNIQQSNRFMVYSTTHMTNGSVIGVITEKAIYTMELTYNATNASYQSNIRIDCDNLNEYGSIVFYINRPDVLEICTEVTDGEYRWNVFNKNARTVTVSNITLDNVTEIIRTHGSILWTTNGPAIIDRAVVNATVPMIGPTITDLYKYIAYLEQRIASLEYYINDGDFRAKSVNECLIDKETTKLFTDERFTSMKMGILPTLTYQEVDTGNDVRPEIGLEVGSYIDFHNVYHNPGGICNEGDSCARLWVPSGKVSDIGGSLVIFNNVIRQAATGYINPNNITDGRTPDQWAKKLHIY